MDDPRDRRAPACLHVGGGARDRPRDRQPANKGGAEIGGTLRDQLCAGAVAAAAHPVRDHRREQRFDPGEECDHQRRGQEFAQPGRGNLGQPWHRQLRGQVSESSADRIDVKPRHRRGQR